MVVPSSTCCCSCSCITHRRVRTTRLLLLLPMWGVMVMMMVAMLPGRVLTRARMAGVSRRAARRRSTGAPCTTTSTTTSTTATDHACRDVQMSTYVRGGWLGRRRFGGGILLLLLCLRRHGALAGSLRPDGLVDRGLADEQLLRVRGAVASGVMLGEAAGVPHPHATAVDVSALHAATVRHVPAHHTQIVVEVGSTALRRRHLIASRLTHTKVCCVGCLQFPTWRHDILLCFALGLVLELHAGIACLSPTAARVARHVRCSALAVLAVLLTALEFLQQLLALVQTLAPHAVEHFVAGVAVLVLTVEAVYFSGTVRTHRTHLRIFFEPLPGVLHPLAPSMHFLVAGGTVALVALRPRLFQQRAYRLQVHHRER
mmetsp:Transcript_23053/g.38605  ORF Transcript_23053/g.38605 Transcript_23053/m.38605 type:complete len:372 (-) Transcript_23053:1739-2854(-)